MTGYCRRFLLQSFMEASAAAPLPAELLLQIARAACLDKGMAYQLSVVCRAFQKLAEEELYLAAVISREVIQDEDQLGKIPFSRFECIYIGFWAEESLVPRQLL